MLFQSYTGGRPAGFVHSTKGRASKDPLGEVEALYTNERRQRAVNDYDDDSDSGDGTGCADNDDDIFDGDRDSFDDSSDDNTDIEDNTDDEDTAGSVGWDSGCTSDRTDMPMTEDTNTCYPTKVNEHGKPVQLNCDAAELDEFSEAKRKYKAVCYEDICL